MGDHFFALGPGHLPARADKIARKHGARLVNYTEPRGEKRHWFAGPNLGEPHDSTMARAVIADLRAAGVIPQDACAHGDTYAVYRRGPKADGSPFLQDGRRCRDCGALV